MHGIASTPDTRNRRSTRAAHPRLGRMTEPPATGAADPGPSTPDDSDWTWVLSRPCPDCGFDASALYRRRGPRGPARRSHAVCRPAGPARRPHPSVGRGVVTPRVLLPRARCLRRHARPSRADPRRRRRARRVRQLGPGRDRASGAVLALRPEDVQREVAAAFEAAATAYGRPVGEQWEWPALRSNGSRFTARTLALYFVHDIRHHLWDVKA